MDKANIDGTVEWVFDVQGKIGDEANKWYDFIRDEVSPAVRQRLGSKPIFRHDKSVLPLKAADLYA